MPAFLRSRFLLLMLSVLLPGIAAAVWAVGHACTAERQAIEQRLGDTTRALSRVVGGELVRQSALDPTARPRPDTLQDIMDRQALPPGWIAAVMDPQGRVAMGHSGATPQGDRPAANLREPLALHGEGLFESNTFDGTPVIAYFSTLPQGWTCVTAMPRSQFTGSLANTATRVALGALVLLGLAAGGAWWMTRRSAGPAGTLLPVQATARPQDSQQIEQRTARDDRAEALGRLTGGVVHDFNNLLGVVSNSAHLIQRQARSPELQLPLAATFRAVEAGSQLTQQLMRFASRRAVPPEPVDLSSALVEAHEFLKAVAGKRIEVSIAVGPDTRRVMVDPGKLELAITHLTLNARDAMPSGGRLRVQACNASTEDTAGLPSGDYVLITVGDDGKGDGPGPDATSSLSRVDDFCARSGGISRRASTPGLGTTVSMLLPAC